MPGTIHYLHNTETGIELIFCTDWCISYPLHNHVSVFTVGIVLEGLLTLTANQETKIYKKNQTFSIPPYVPHSISADDSYSLLSLCIPKDILQRYSMDLIKNNFKKFLTVLQNTRKIDSLPTEPSLSRSNVLPTEAILAQLDTLPTEPSLSQLNALPTGFTSARQNSFIVQLKEQLELHPEDTFRVSSMAQQAFISKYHFIRSFKKEVGLTPHQFQIQNRIRKAQRSISKTETIAEAALLAGFWDQSHFTKQFEKYVGLTPSDYKRSYHTFS
ncbi:MAG: helix-turn-helix transcriptional regulator [Lachnospiraceae bacterium]|nr:helix-turn-helix transcriptional regulator [Lachnospiraceae bacterium]